MILGFTGTRNGMTTPQRDALRKLLKLFPYAEEFHHGDCKGADEQAHIDVRHYLPLAKIHLHPPKNDKHRAFMHPDVLYDEEDYLTRNVIIVKACSVLIGAPKGLTDEKRGSGTWYALRQGERTGKTVIIIWPNGIVTRSINEK